MKTLKITISGPPKTGKITAELIEEMLTSLSCEVEVNDPSRRNKPSKIAPQFGRDTKFIIDVEQG